MSARPSYQDRRPYVVPADLADLHGPSHGLVDLPPSVAWSGRRQYDLDVPGDAVILYERAIVEAPTAMVLQDLLNRALLVRLWSTLFLPHRTRELWLQRFPSLARAA